MKSVSIIGSGISGLAASCFIARAGMDVTVYEKNETIGGRARFFTDKGFTFDMGPSWYWMPDVYEDFFNQFNKSASDFYELKQLDPGFQVIFSATDVMKVPADMESLRAMFEAREKGSAEKLDRFLKEAAFKYNVGMKELVRKPAYSWMEYARLPVLKAALRMNIFNSVRSYVRRYFRDPGLVSLLEFPVLFLGAMPDKIPALYTLMNHAALSQGTFYPMGGMSKVISGIASLAESLGVSVNTGAAVHHLHVENARVNSLSVNDRQVATDAVIAAADYHHVEQHLLAAPYRNYTADYWDSRTLAPSCLVYYVGVSKRLPRLEHHNLFFDTDFEQHARDIYAAPCWPSDPLCYVCCPSRTDPSVAPEGQENLFILIPVAPGLQGDEVVRSEYYDKVIKKIESFCDVDFREDIVVSHPYSISDFIKDYNAFKGNAYGLANTLLQTAVLKPRLRNKKVSNLFYTGQLTVPGPGLPPALISGEIVAGELIKQLKKEHR
ncbi:phytoene desaturase family protein [Chitinophagaceae bacterium MMS25-I14]